MHAVKSHAVIERSGFLLRLAMGRPARDGSWRFIGVPLACAAPLILLASGLTRALPTGFSVRGAEARFGVQVEGLRLGVRVDGRVFATGSEGRADRKAAARSRSCAIRASSCMTCCLLPKIAQVFAFARRGFIQAGEGAALARLMSRSLCSQLAVQDQLALELIAQRRDLVAQRVRLIGLQVKRPRRERPFKGERPLRRLLAATVPGLSR